MANLILLNVNQRNGIDFSPSREYVIDLDDLESIIRENASGDCYFTLREIKGVSTQNGNYAKVNYVVDENLAAIDALSTQVFALTVLQRNADSDSFPESINFFEKKFMAYVREIEDTLSPFFGKTEFYYAESGDPDGVYYIVDEPLSYFVTSTTPPIPTGAIDIENTLFVDSVYGNNGTALPERMDKPYLTVAGAMAIATAGQMVFVRPGDHGVAVNIFKDGVKVWLEPNANLNFTGAGVNHITVPGIANQTFSILGNGKINGLGASIITASAGSTGSLITIQADEVVYNNAAGTMVNCTDAKVLWDVRKTTQSNGVGGFLFQGISESDISAGVYTNTSAVMTSRPYQLNNIVSDANIKTHKFSCLPASNISGQDLGWVALATTQANNVIEINLNGIYLPATAGLGSCVAFNGDGNATIRGEFYTTGGGIFAGLGTGRIINYAFVKTVDTLTAVRVASISGLGIRFVNNGILRGSSSDYAVGLGVVDDASVSGAGQTSGFGSFENHGTIINENSAATGVIFKAGVAPSDTVLILGAETVLYATSLGADSIDALVAQDVKCYGYPVANRNVDVLITNLISGTNIIFDPLVETNYLT